MSILIPISPCPPSFLIPSTSWSPPLSSHFLSPSSSSSLSHPCSHPHEGSQPLPKPQDSAPKARTRLQLFPVVIFLTDWCQFGSGRRENAIFSILKTARNLAAPLSQSRGFSGPMVWIFNSPQRSHGAARLSSLSLPCFPPPLPIATSEVPPNDTMGVTSQLGSHQAEELLAPCSSKISWRAMEVLELQRKATGSSSKAADQVQLAWTPLKVLMVFHGQANVSFQGLEPASSLQPRASAFSRCGPGSDIPWNSQTSKPAQSQHWELLSRVSRVQWMERTGPTVTNLR